MTFKKIELNFMADSYYNETLITNWIKTDLFQKQAIPEFHSKFTKPNKAFNVSIEKYSF